MSGVPAREDTQARSDVTPSMDETASALGAEAPAPHGQSTHPATGSTDQDGVLSSILEAIRVLTLKVDSQQRELTSLRGMVGLPQGVATAIPSLVPSATPRVGSEAGDSEASRDQTVDVDLSHIYMPLAAAAASWAARNREVKLRPFPHLGKDLNKNQVPYTRWKVYVLSALEAANLTCILRDEPPVVGVSPQHEVDFWQSANSAVYHEILLAVGDLSVLADIVQRKFGQPRAAHLAWVAVKSHFIREAQNVQLFLNRKLLELEPRKGESMDSFLNRCAMLQNEYLEHGTELQDQMLIIQVLSQFPIQWQSRAGLDKGVQGMTWAEVASALQAEDNARRQSNTAHPEALLPLGWTRHAGGGGAAPARSGTPAQKETSSPSSSGAQKGKSTASTTGQASQAGGGGSRPSSPGRGPPRRQGGPPPAFVCWYCLQPGHSWGKCYKLPKGWTPDAKAKREALAKEEELRKRREQSERDKAAHAVAKAATQKGSSSSSEGRATGSI